MSRWSAEAVAAATQKLDEAQVAQDLQLLANLVTDVAVGGMQVAEFFCKRINLW